MKTANKITRLAMSLILFCTACQLQAQTKVTTLSVGDSGIHQSSAACLLNVQTTEFDNISEWGIVYSTNHNPTIENGLKQTAQLQKPSDARGKQVVVWLADLASKTTYYVCGFVKMKNGNVIYGNEKSFATKVPTDTDHPRRK